MSSPPPPTEEDDEDLPPLEPDHGNSRSITAIFRDIVRLMQDDRDAGPPWPPIALEIPASVNSILSPRQAPVDFYAPFFGLRPRPSLSRNAGVDNEWGAFLADVLEPRARRAPPPSELGRILEETLSSSQPAYKGVLSEAGEEAVTEKHFDPVANADQPTCPITQAAFGCGDAILELPCGHIFDPSGIMVWLRQESATCPVCRRKLPSREVRVEAPPGAPVRDPSGARGGTGGMTRMLRNISFLNQPARTTGELPWWGIRQLLERQEGVHEEKELQEAILASLRTR